MTYRVQQLTVRFCGWAEVGDSGTMAPADVAENVLSDFDPIGSCVFI